MDGLHVSRLEVGLGLVSVLVGVAQLAVDLAVWALGAQLVVQSPLAVVAGEAAPVVEPRLGCHFLSLKHLVCTKSVPFSIQRKIT